VRRAARAAALVVVLVGLVAAVGCGSSRPARSQSRPRPATSTTARGTTPTVAATTTATAATTTTRTTPTTRATPQPVTLAFGGDVHFDGILRPQLLDDATGMLDPVAPILAAADVAMVNLETAITERGTPQPKTYRFRAPPLAYSALRAAGSDVATMANNHGVDFGPVGLVDSIAAARAARFPVVGIGNDAAEAYAPYRVTVRGTRLAFLGATQVLDGPLEYAWTARGGHPGLASALQVDDLLAAVRGARATSDVVVVYLHWGTEGETCPQSSQRGLARRLVDAGADVVVGTHAHRQQGAGRLGAALVDYGLGNFVFYNPSGPGTVSGVLTVTLLGRHVTAYHWIPAVLQHGVPHPLTGDAADDAAARWLALRQCTDLAP
jgi:poly-gamma-glutamate synthesis protein (capsule biosynthesis protein)